MARVAQIKHHLFTLVLNQIADVQQLFDFTLMLKTLLQVQPLHFSQFYQFGFLLLLSCCRWVWHILLPFWATWLIGKVLTEALSDFEGLDEPPSADW